MTKQELRSNLRYWPALSHPFQNLGIVLTEEMKFIQFTKLNKHKAIRRPISNSITLLNILQV